MLSSASLKHDDFEDLVIAVKAAPGSPDDRLFLLRHDRSQGTWAESSSAFDAPGSIVNLQSSGALLFAGIHHSPSASDTLVFDSNLVLRDRIPGWIVLLMTNGSFVWEHSEPHFAPTFPTELFLYDGASRQSRQIFPLRPFHPYRKALIRAIQAAYDRAGWRWCAEHNHHCDAERLDTSLVRIVADPEGDSLAFAIGYDEHPTSLRRQSDRFVIYLYRHVSDPTKISYTERPLPRGAPPPTRESLLAALGRRPAHPGPPDSPS